MVKHLNSWWKGILALAGIAFIGSMVGSAKAAPVSVDPNSTFLERSILKQPTPLDPPMNSGTSSPSGEQFIDVRSHFGF